ncbi:MAG: PEP-CTERM sorting domain-containing protein, partial [Myxococcota bacterium]|nr:PEP-CTERM sorting domain-containing protein [Myxococcota bacterium]
GYVMSGGSLRVDDLKLSRNAIFIQDGTAASTTVHNDLTLFDGSVLLFSAGDFTVEGDAFVHSDLPGGVDHRDGAMTVDGALTLGEDETDSGHYMLRGDHETSTLDVHGNEIIGAAGRGSFEQVGGTHTTHGWLVLGEQAGSDGTYDLRFSDLIVGDPALHVEERIGWLGEGTFDHPDGSHTVYGHLILGAQDDGEGNRVTEGDGRGTYDLRLFGKLEVNGQETIGLYGQGTLNQSVVSTHTVNGDLVVGSGAGSTGVYDLENGVLDVSGTLTVGRRGGGTFTQGVLDTLPALLSVETSSLMIGDEQVGSGVFELNGGELNVISQLTIGNSGDGVFTHNGGTVTAGNLDIGLETGSSGKYEMFGADSRLTVSGRTLVGNDDWAVTPANDASFWHREGEVDSQLVQVYRDAYYRLGSNDLGEPATLTSVETRVLDGGYFSLEPSGTHDVDSLQILGRREFSEDGGLQYFRSAYVNWGGDLNAGSCEVGRWGRYTQYTSSGHRLSYADCGEDSMHNQGTIEIFGEGTSTLEGAIHNHALFQVDDTTALLPGTLNNHDRVLVSNSSVTMGSLNVTADGYVVADAGTSIRIDGHFSNSSEQNALWDTDRAALILAGGVGMSITLAGEDQGISRDGLLDNFAWGRVSVLDGTEVEFQDGNPANDGTALYMRILDIEDRDSLDFENLVIAIFSGDASLYYDPTRSENDYLGGLVWRFAQGGGFLGPVVIPEPSTAWLLGLGLALLTRRRRRPRSSPRR